MPHKSSFLTGSLHVLVLCSFALAQPLFSLLSGYAEFFVARQTESVDLILLTLTLCLGLPVLLILLEGLARAVGTGFYKYAHVGIVTVLTAAIILQLLKKIAGVPGIALVSGAVLLAIMCSVTYIRFDLVRTYLTFLSPVILLFPGLFLLNSEVSRIVFPEQVELQLGNVESETPVVMVVFDEFPLTSLMNEQHQIDPIRFPNFSRLASESHWFRNATTVSDSTLLSVPAIVSGLSPRLQDPRIPTTTDYPDTLFTLLGGSYRLEIFENATQLSPASSAAVKQAVTQRMSGLISDLTIVYGHMLLPIDLASGLPPVNQSWNNFKLSTPEFAEIQDGSNDFQTLLDFQTDDNNRAGKFREFIDSIQTNEQPTLFFLHSMLPHTPWQYLPNGRQYSLTQSSIPGMTTSFVDSEGTFPSWGNDTSMVNEGYQRHLLQVGFVDTLVGDLIGKLEEAGLYDRSLIVVTADHGTSFRTNDFSRRANETNHSDIMWIPLFLKTPYQEEGVVNDRNVETIDILPTVADALGIEVPWETDGRSAFDQTLPERSAKTILAGRTQEIVANPNSNSQDESLRRKLELFGSGAWDSLFDSGLYADLLGERVNQIALGEAGIGVEFDGEGFFSNVNFDSAFLLTHITGHILTGPSPYPSGYLAIAVNDTVQSVTELADSGDFSALVAESAFMQGQNDVEAFLVVEVGGVLRLDHLSKTSRSYYSIIKPTGEEIEALRRSDGESVLIVPGDALGYTRARINEENEMVSITGWAASIEQSEMGVTILIFQNQELLYSGIPRTLRPDVTAVYPEWAALTPGFSFELPLARFESLDQTEVRVFALTPGGPASELGYLRDTWDFAINSPTTN
jgi:hypothetical protein